MWRSQDCGRAHLAGLRSIRAVQLAVTVLLVACLAACASVVPGSDVSKTRSSALERPDRTRLGQAFDAAARAHGSGSGFRLQPTGIDGFLTRVQLADAAEHTLDVQYYIFQDDDTGKLLAAAILRAADRGVRVRVLLDDTVVPGRGRQIELLDEHPRIEVRLFNPFAYRGGIEVLRAAEFLFNASRLDYRMHNKLFVVDNAAAIVGGRNIGDEYFQGGSRFEFGDYDVFAVGPIVKRLSESFDSFWNSDMAVPLGALGDAQSPVASLNEYRQLLDEHRDLTRDTEFARRLGTGEPLAGLMSGSSPLVWAHAAVVYDSPYKAQVESGEIPGRLLRLPLAKAAAAVEHELLLVSPYFTPGENGMHLLAELRERGVRVRVLTNSLDATDVPAAHAAYARYRVALLEEGVELHEVRRTPGQPSGSGAQLASAGSGGFALHAKVFVFDRRKLFIGSMNFDRRSMRLNTELGLIIDSPELARQVAARFEAIARPENSYVLSLRQDGVGAPSGLIWRTAEAGKIVEYDTEPVQDAWQKVMVDLFSLLPLEEVL